MPQTGLPQASLPLWLSGTLFLIDPALLSRASAGESHALISSFNFIHSPFWRCFPDAVDVRKGVGDTTMCSGLIRKAVGFAKRHVHGSSPTSLTISHQTSPSSLKTERRSITSLLMLSS
jgi:hypothetical protein